MCSMADQRCGVNTKALCNVWYKYVTQLYFPFNVSAAYSMMMSLCILVQYRVIPCQLVWHQLIKLSGIIKFVYKNALRLNRYNFRTVNAIDFLFSTLHSTPFLYVDLYLCVLHKLRADVMRPDYPWDSKQPHLQVGASNSFQIQCLRRGVLSLLIFSVRYFLCYPLRRYSCAKLMHISCSTQPVFHSPNPQ